jgi:hypothetical protein
VQIESREIKNCRLFCDAKLEPSPRMAVVAGANAWTSPRCLTTPMCPTRLDGCPERVLLLLWRSLADFSVDVPGVMQTPRGRGL